MKLLKTNFEIIAICSLLIVVRTAKAKAYKRVVIHVPMKVKHHHHTHTVFKHVHHQIPVHYDHHDVHVIHPETHGHEDYDSHSHNDYHYSHGRGIDSLVGDVSSYADGDADKLNDYENFEKYLRRRSKHKQKIFNNMVIGWKGRSDFDKIASEYLTSIKKQRLPENDYYDDVYSTYDDEGLRKKRK